jgi:thiol:disulfide interchange protein
MRFPRSSNIRQALLLIPVLLLFSVSGQAQWGARHPIQAELVSEYESIRPGEPFTVGLYLEMDDKWHTYYKNPGFSGLSTTIEWSLPEGFEAGPMQWPAPIRFETAGLVSYGYEEQVLHPVLITPPADLQPGERIEFEASARWLACKESCIPGQASLSLELVVLAEEPEKNRQWAPLFEATRQVLPRQSDHWLVGAGRLGDGRVELMLKWDSSGRSPAVLDADPVALDLYFYADEKSQVDPGAAQVVNRADNSISMDLSRPEDAEGQLGRLQGVLVSNVSLNPDDDVKALRIDVAVTEQAPAGVVASTVEELEGSEKFTLMTASLFAFLGGLILNLMPCVFPVLSIKILGFVQQAGEDKKKIFSHGLVFSAGVLFCFWLLAGALIILRATGEQLGWGFQLQTPAFIVGLAILLFLFALNLAGVFEVGSSLTGVGGKMMSRGGYSGSFFSGVLATIIATPCTAPFMGSAIGFALVQPWWSSLTIFTFLALGMATPYMLLSSMPGLLRFLPRPGPWMVAFKQLMAFPLFATVIWLAWVFGLQTGIDGVTRLWIGLLIIALGAYVYGRWDTNVRTPTVRLTARGVTLVFLVAGGWLAFSGGSSASVHAASAQGGKFEYGLDWQSYSPGVVAELRQEGNPVFIDFTAAWCLTCQVNKRVAFTSEEVQNRFRELGVSMVRADWTNRNPEITEAMEEFGRSGVPLYVLYGPQADAEPRILPEVINPGIVLRALDEMNREAS